MIIVINITPPATFLNHIIRLFKNRLTPLSHIESKNQSVITYIIL